MTRRELLALASTATLVRAKEAPTAPVAIARCASYDDNLSSTLQTMFDQVGLDRMVANKTITIKLNLTGSPSQRFQGKPLGSTHYTHPKTIAAMIAQLDRAGAKRIRLVESCAATAGPLEEYMLDSGWNVRSLQIGGNASQARVREHQRFGKIQEVRTSEVCRQSLHLPCL